MSHFQLSQVKKSRSLASELAESLRDEIVKGNFKVGEKIPASKDIEQQAGVSRSVVREAIAQLKAEGWVDSKQGVGVFVIEKTTTNTFEITASEFECIHNAIQILELRLSVEVEMCAMAAENHSRSQITEIYDWMHKMEDKIAKGEDAVTEDLNFHKAIADASGNPYFTRFIDYIGSGVIPARDIITQNNPEPFVENFLEIIQQEHREIADSIKSKNPDLARQAVKAHLGNSIQRHKLLAEAIIG
ncbi:FadR/GntR family transcriptional regulator [Algibacillus agarilyticus]|uniref:FadR/GntR family transcriptional regulator n=1 Tax=Algibacillus agarilyticus TaxID=2234133 RepID=UPI000DCF9A35|nr:FadR/GntR family transcriptional regulator [Algibacillus agarilyticus]